jgi:hypothetical protein
MEELLVHKCAHGFTFTYNMKTQQCNCPNHTVECPWEPLRELPVESILLYSQVVRSELEEITPLK